MTSSSRQQVSQMQDKINHLEAKLTSPHSILSSLLGLMKEHMPNADMARALSQLDMQMSNSSTNSVHSNAAMAIRCGCNQPARLMISRTVRNWGKPFYKCDSCQFFRWWDEVTPNPIPISVGNSLSVGNMGATTGAADIRKIEQAVNELKDVVSGIAAQLAEFKNVNNGIELGFSRHNSTLARIATAAYIMLMIIVLIGSFLCLVTFGLLHN